MHRSPVAVRHARAEDVASLLPLWEQFCAQEDLAGAAAGVPGDVGDRVGERLRESAAAVEAGRPPTYRLAVASHDGEDVGFASLSVVERGLLAVSSAVVVDVVHVVDGQRKRGVGTALLREALVLAEEVGASDVVVNTPSRGRDVNRFYARLGFSPMVVRRSSSVSALRRRIGSDPRLELTGELTPVQRSLRRRALLTPRRPAVVRSSDGRAAGR
ncbi:MAG TPA: GNAT family N-acetyltransferase [Candidatus Nanopelagicales bacterium]|nr:GNAT family N-acetyltransferase [Candidatus Nanopelagicales bacterium]